MKLCWTFRGMPELSHLPEGQRMQLIRAAVTPKARAILIGRSVLIGLGAGWVLLVIFDLSAWTLPGGLLGAGMALVVGLVWYQSELLRIRKMIRTVLEEASEDRD